MLDTLIPLAVDGLASAALIFFVAVGLTLVFSVLRVLNVAHGSFYSIGAYVAASIGLWIAGAGLNPWLSFPALILRVRPGTHDARAMRRIRTMAAAA